MTVQQTLASSMQTTRLLSKRDILPVQRLHEAEQCTDAQETWQGCNFVILARSVGHLNGHDSAIGSAALVETSDNNASSIQRGVLG